MKRLLASLSLLFILPLQAEPIWTDPAKAAAEDPDFLMQGEYHKEGASHGLQVVALGDGKFDGYLLEGGGAALAVPAANALGSLSVDRHEQGSAAALLAAAPPAGFIFGPLLGATLYQIGAPLPLYMSAMVMAVLGAYAVLVVGRRPIG